MSETQLVPLSIRRGDGKCPFGPAAEFARLRAEEPVVRVDAPLPLAGEMPVWLVTRYADVREVMGDSDRFSNILNPDVALPDYVVGNPNFYDPPEHTRLRRFLGGEFTLKRVQEMRPRIEEIIEGCLDDMERSGPPADLVQSFALPVPSLVICELLGVPYDDRADFQRRTATLLDYSRPLQEQLAAQAEMHGYIMELAARNRTAPGDNVLGRVVREHGDELSDQELGGIGATLLVGGHETSTHMLALGTLLLLQHPEQAALVRDDPEVAGSAVEELMRYLSVASASLPRRAVVDTVVGGQAVKAGEVLVCALQSANRDEALTPDPDRFDVTRRPTPQVGFGFGPHQCLGQQLARLEMRIAFPALLRRFPGLRSAVPLEEIPFRRNLPVHGVERLPLAW
ncbi:cytochrome P450 [Streptosporangium becharense]|uniref:Cytochrome P450 n=1 Tax=Streptosporangium becharense TaxID=1816182 RepID=A0A7W9MII0_9ACTN|nr:cytochrome P450 [Streptosporangium becharense]MBB2911394.1 cytochrome P450 [Streptosporangium becharense]MBB5821548.1 cytochrome P450 [Streptosporangium becharense]